MKEKKRELWGVIILVCVVTSLHYFTISRHWAIHDFYRRLYYIPIIIAAFKFRLKGGVITSVVISFLYSPHIFIYWGYEDIGMVNQILEIVLFLFIGSITGYLVEQLYRNNVLLSEQLERITEVEILNENIQNSMINPLIAVDLDKRIQIINHIGRDVFTDINQGNYWSDIQDADVKKMSTSIDAVLNGKVTKEKKEIRILRGNDQREYKVWLYPLKNYEGLLQGAVIVMEDITEVLKLEKEVRRSEKLSAIGMMASGIAHEIRNPLGIVKTIAQTIQADGLPTETQNNGMAIIVNEVDRTNEVIKELLNFSKPEKGILTLCSLNALIDELIRMSGKFAEQKQVQIINEVQQQVSVKIVKEKMKQALLNLILNAIDAMPVGGQIHISETIIDTRVQLRIKDEGMGIHSEDIEKIFNPFYTKKEKGTGLGLAVTHKIIEEHKGKIHVESELNKGTTFIIDLPLYTEGAENEN